MHIPRTLSRPARRSRRRIAVAATAPSALCLLLAIAAHGESAVHLLPSSLTLSKGEWSCLIGSIDVYLKDASDPVYIVHNANCTTSLSERIGEVSDKTMTIDSLRKGWLSKTNPGLGNEMGGSAGSSGYPPYVHKGTDTGDTLSPVKTSEGFYVPPEVKSDWGTTPYKPLQNDSQTKLPNISALSKDQLSCLKAKAQTILATDVDPRTFNFAECQK